MYRYLILTISVAILILNSCANVHSLNGGEKDVTPPRDSIYLPENYHVNFNSNSFSIKFDEYIKLNDINNQLIVSPPLAHPPKVHVRKKTLEVLFDDSLLENTTYIFNFGEAVVDYTEGNPAHNLSYVFSTGNELDSLSISGTCIDAYSNKPLKGVRVMVYRDTLDSLPYTTKPFYFAVTDDLGHFSIPYMKKGDYKVFSLQDDNGNYLYDDGESMGFVEKRIKATPSDSLQEKVKLALSVSLPKQQEILDYSSDSSGFVVFSLLKKASALNFEVLELPEAQFATEQTVDSTYFWITKSQEKDKIFKLVVRDDGEVLDTLFLLYFPSHTPRIDWAMPKTRTVIAKDSSVVLQSIHSLLLDVDTSKVVLIMDSVPIPVKVQLDKKAPRKLIVDGEFEENKSYELTILPGGITARNNIVNDTLIFPFKTENNSNFGQLNIAIPQTDTSSVPLVLQLLDSNDKVIFQQKITDESKVEIKGLKAKKYKLLLIEDQNENNQWDPGDYMNKIQPEKIYYFPETIQVKPNWVLEYEWEILED